VPTPIEILGAIQYRAEGFQDPELLPIRVLRPSLRTDALRYAVGVVGRIATERGMEECMAEDCTIDNPRCAVRIAQSELQGRLGRWRG
jgi:hypothetical protein